LYISTHGILLFERQLIGSENTTSTVFFIIVIIVLQFGNFRSSVITIHLIFIISIIININVVYIQSFIDIAIPRMVATSIINI